MTVETIVDELAAEVKVLAEQVKGRTDLTIGEAVRLVLPLVRALAAQLVSWVCAQGSRYDRADCPCCGQPMQRRGHRPRTVMSYFGTLHLAVPRLRCESCQTEVSPLLERSQLRRGCTPEVWTEVVEEATDDPYRQVEERLARFGIGVSDSQVEALVNEVGGELAAAEAELAEAVAQGEVPGRCREAPQRLYVLVDARSVRVGREWREVKVGVIYETPARGPDQNGPPPAERVTSFAYCGPVEEFMRRFYVELVRRGVWQATEVILLGDGARWIWDWLPGLIPLGTKKVEILDFFHAAENLQKAVTAVYGEGTDEGRAKFRELRCYLKMGHRRAIVAVLEDLRQRAVGEDAHRTVANVLGYVREHWERLSYLRCRCDGLHIGSGVVESQCKRLGQRIKGPGMNWSPAGLAALLAIDNHRQRSVGWPMSKAA